MVDLDAFFEMDEQERDRLIRGMKLQVRKKAISIAREVWGLTTVPCAPLARHSNLDDLLADAKKKAGSHAVYKHLYKVLSIIVALDMARAAPSCIVVVPRGQDAQSDAQARLKGDSNLKILGVSLNEEFALREAMRRSENSSRDDFDIAFGTRRLFVQAVWRGSVEASGEDWTAPWFVLKEEGLYDVCLEAIPGHVIWPELPGFPKLKVAFAVNGYVEVFSYDGQTIEQHRYGPIVPGSDIVPDRGSPALRGAGQWPHAVEPYIHCGIVAELSGAWQCDDELEWMFFTGAGTQLSLARSQIH